MMMMIRMRMMRMVRIMVNIGTYWDILGIFDAAAKW